MPSGIDAALVRLRAAQALAAGGRIDPAREVLAPAIAFFERAGATRMLAEAARLG
jgi:hypothetical protein